MTADLIKRLEEARGEALRRANWRAIWKRHELRGASATAVAAASAAFREALFRALQERADG